jgi:hypothetical protein
VRPSEHVLSDPLASSFGFFSSACLLIRPLLHLSTF